MTALVLELRQAGFTGKADTDKLINAFANLQVKQGHDFPTVT